MEKFKIGDKVECLPGLTMGQAGNGYVPGAIYTVKSIDRYGGGDDDVYWFKEIPSGVFGRGLKLYNEQPNYEIY